MKKGYRGFSLVEAITALSIAAVLGGVVITLFIIQNRQFSEGVANGALQMQFDSFISELADTVRGASCVLDDGEVWHPIRPARQETNTSAIAVIDLQGGTLARYRINKTLGRLEEYESGDKKWVSYMVAGTEVTIDNESADMCYFSLPGSRDAVDVSLVVSTSIKGEHYTLLLKGGAFRCRSDK
jgi:hypothetical protein